MLGSGAFNLERAVLPFRPRRPLSGGPVGVTYDGEADAAFIYLRMKKPVANLLEATLRYSHSITPVAQIALDSKGGLIWLRFSPEDANSSSADFVSLIDAPVDHARTT